MKRVIPHKPISTKIVSGGTVIRIECGHSPREGGKK